MCLPIRNRTYQQETDPREAVEGNDDTTSSVQCTHEGKSYPIHLKPHGFGKHSSRDLGKAEKTMPHD